MGWIEHGDASYIEMKNQDIAELRAKVAALEAENGRLKAVDARAIVTRLVTDAVAMQWTRSIEPALADHELEPLTEQQLIDDALALALSDDIGCLDEQDDDFRENVGLYWLEDLLAARSQQPSPAQDKEQP